METAQFKCPLFGEATPEQPSQSENVVFMFIQHASEFCTVVKSSGRSIPVNVIARKAVLEPGGWAGHHPGVPRPSGDRMGRESGLQPWAAN